MFVCVIKTHVCGAHHFCRARAHIIDNVLKQSQNEHLTAPAGAAATATTRVCAQQTQNTFGSAGPNVAAHMRHTRARANEYANIDIRFEFDFFRAQTSVARASALEPFLPRITLQNRALSRMRHAGLTYIYSQYANANNKPQRGGGGGGGRLTYTIRVDSLY